MKFVAVVLAVVFLAMAGCATLGLNENATEAEKAAAKASDCASAREAYVVADQALNTPGMDAEATQYWNTYKAGAQLGITIACGVAAVPATTAVAQ